MFHKYIWLLLLFVTIFFLYSNEYMEKMRWDFTNGTFDVLDLVNSMLYQKSITPAEEISISNKIFTVNELQKYTNLENGLYLSILGQVYDVTKGIKHYGPGATYHAFTGRDASLAFITGEFNEEDLTDDISSLSVQQVKALNDWLTFYNENYIYKGKLKGRYYNENGSPTTESYEVQKKIIWAKEENLQEEQKKQMFPPCNIEWNSQTGTAMWCSKKSGGIERDWIGVPRLLFEPVNSKQSRCACVKLDSKEYEEMKGTFKEYEGCPKDSTKCFIKSNKL